MPASADAPANTAPSPAGPAPRGRGGRPRLPDGERRRVQVNVVFTAQEAAAITAAAAATGLPLAAWVRARALRDRAPALSHSADLRTMWRESAALQSNFSQLVARLNELHSAGELTTSAAAQNLAELRHIAPQMYALVKALRLDLARAG